MSRSPCCHETPTGSYTNQGQHASGKAVINNINQYNPPDPLKELEKRCSHNAAFDSAARFDPPRCAESTRLRIIQIIEEWINHDRDTVVPSSLFWLHGGAGVGKSALAQSLSEKFQEKNQLAASFFFFRNDPTRNNGEHLIPTLASHLVCTFQGIVAFVRNSINENPALFTKRCQTQIQKLLIEPLLVLKASESAIVTHPRLIVIDGLDECKSTDFQCELLRVIVGAIPQIPYPLRFLLTSRPEAHITHFFDHDRDLQVISVHRYNLSDDPDADIDIRNFLETEFEEIRRVHRLRQYLPQAWPDQKAIDSLVERSSDHFIYASTVIRYIRSSNHRPHERLDVILRLRPPRQRDQPYAQLDALYRFIFQCIESDSRREKICLVLGILDFQSRKVGFFSGLGSDYTTIEGLLEMEAGELVLLLDPVLSLVAIDDNQSKVRILHKCLFDFLLDVTRGGHLLNLARVHELAATHILKQKIEKGVCTVNNFRDFAYHCQYATLDDTLKHYLHFLDIPFPKCDTTLIEKFPMLGNDLKLSLRSTIWFLFRTLSREDFDSTGQVYGRFAAKWMSYLLRPPVPGPKQPLIRAAVAKLNSSKNWLKLKLVKPPTESKPQDTAVTELDDLKREIDLLLMKWKPQNFTPMDAPMESAKRVKQEHNVFSAYTKASCTDAIVSSLVSGVGFIHAYDFGICQDEESFLALRTYSEHGNTCYQHTFVGRFDNVQNTQDYLRMFEKYLHSVLQQKYGLEPDVDTPNT